MQELTFFENIAPHLANPLTLAGFALLLAFGVHRSLLQSALLRPLSARSSSVIVRLILRYGFILAVLVVLSGFGLAAWRVHSSVSGKVPLSRVEAEALLQKNRGNIEECIRTLPDARFLNFFFSQQPGGNVQVDILLGEGRSVTRANFWHTNLPGGVYSWPDLTRMLATRLPPGAPTPDPPPPDVDVSKRLYLASTNPPSSNPHGYVDVVEFGEKLSVGHPELNRCLVDVLRDGLRQYSLPSEESAFLHKYITRAGGQATK